MLDQRLLDRYRLGKSSTERAEALEELKNQEQSGRITPGDLLPLLQAEDYYLQSYAIAALGRLQAAEGIKPLLRLFEQSENPLVLTLLLECFQSYGLPEFGAAVVEKLTPPSRWFGKRNSEFEFEFIEEQLLLPALKYFQISGFPKARKLIERKLNHPDPILRLNALLALEKLRVQPKDGSLQALTQDPNPLVASLAKKLLEPQ